MTMREEVEALRALVDDLRTVVIILAVAFVALCALNAGEAWLRALS